VIADSYAEQLPRSYLYSRFITVIDLAAFDRAFLDRFKVAPSTRTATTAAARWRLANGYPMAMVPAD
jgi:hypothetical protein